MHEVDPLIQRYLEGRLTEVEAEALQVELEKDPTVGERLLQHLEMDAMLRATRPAVIDGPDRLALMTKRRFTLWTVALVGAAAACVALVGGWGLSSWLPERAAEEETTAAVAVLTKGVNLEWASAAIMTGAPLAPGWLELKSGIAQIEFYRGARVRIEGPAELELVSAGEATCRKGKLSAHVPPQAKGFRINTPQGTIVDLGTDFALDLNDANGAVHVFKGEVEVHGAAEVQSVAEGEAMRLFGGRERGSADAEGFAGLRDLELRSEQFERSALERWREASRQLNRDSGLRVHFDFQEAGDARSLWNGAQGAAGVEDGSIVGAGWTEGRWPGKGALEFRNVSDRVRLMVPGQTRALTMAMWVRVNGLDRKFNSLFMSEGWGERRVHWQITKEGRVRLGVAGKGVRGGKASHQDHDTPVWFTPERLGRWTHLAVVFDPDRMEVRHYANGERLAVSTITDASALTIGMAELGNWNESSGAAVAVAIRHLSGAIDEFALWDRALADQEVKRLLVP